MYIFKKTLNMFGGGVWMLFVIHGLMLGVK